MSPNYATELQSGPDKGVELDDVVREVGVTGIVNGMDVTEWDPSEDKYLDAKYDITNVSEPVLVYRLYRGALELTGPLFFPQVLENKPLLKESLQAEVGLPVNPDVPIVAFIGRLEEQKGSDILSAAVEEILKEDVQLIVLVSRHIGKLPFFIMLLLSPGECCKISRMEAQPFRICNAGNGKEVSGEAVGAARDQVPH